VLSRRCCSAPCAPASTARRSEQVGADAAVSGLPFTLAQLDEFRAVPGVEAIAPVYSTRGSQLSIDGRQRSTTLIVIDTAEMRAVQAGRADATPLPEALAGDGGGDGVPVLLSGLVDGLVATADDVELDGEPFQAAGVVDGTTAVLAARQLGPHGPGQRPAVHRHARAREPSSCASRRVRMPRPVTAGLATISGEGTTVVTPGELARNSPGGPTARAS
jgi:putative ABC transport system permease protein